MQQLRPSGRKNFLALWLMHAILHEIQIVFSTQAPRFIIFSTLYRNTSTLLFSITGDYRATKNQISNQL